MGKGTTLWRMPDDARFTEIDASLAEIDNRLRTIAHQNAVLSEMVEVLGQFVAVNIDALTRHASDRHGA